MARLLQRTLVQPVLNLLRIGMSPRRLAWSLALGAVIGVNPLLGSTTGLSLAAAAALRLNIVASQVSNHAMYPLELALFPVWIGLGARLFGTPPLVLGHGAVKQAIEHPWATARMLWTWEWHGLVVWAVASIVLAPLIASALIPLLTRALQRLHNEPIVEQ